MKVSIRLADALMRTIRIIAQILILYIFYYIGVFIVHITGLPLPASILGLVLLAFCLKMNWVKVDYIREGAGFLIGFMTLFFIPPIVGIIDYPELLSVNGFLLLGTVFVSTLFAILISSKFSEVIEKKEIALLEKKEFNQSMMKKAEAIQYHKSGQNLELQQPNTNVKEDEVLESNHLHR
ncbi:MAG TPA: CidA/LrgA family protein [Ureibacillus sp.]|nr:CidA/LrgA family protein [Ureibacillus sp.]